MMSLKLVLRCLILISAANVQGNSPVNAQENSPANAQGTSPASTKLSLLPNFANLNSAALAEKLRTFFGFENAGTTLLGKLGAWKGDLLQPKVLLVFGVLAISSIVGLVYVIVNAIIDLKPTLIGKVFNIFSAIFDVLLKKLLLFKDPILARMNAFAQPSEDDNTPAANRRRRAIQDLSEVIETAIHKYTE